MPAHRPAEDARLIDKRFIDRGPQHLGRTVEKPLALRRSTNWPKHRITPNKPKRIAYDPPVVALRGPGPGRPFGQLDTPALVRHMAALAAPDGPGARPSAAPPDPLAGQVPTRKTPAAARQLARGAAGTVRRRRLSRACVSDGRSG